jgi:hypothetical protein
MAKQHTYRSGRDPAKQGKSKEGNQVDKDELASRPRERGKRHRDGAGAGHDDSLYFTTPDRLPQQGSFHIHYRAGDLAGR